MDKITVLFPGGFKPLTGAHLALAQRYADSPQVGRVIMLIGPTPRDGITREQTIEIFDLIGKLVKKVQLKTTSNQTILNLKDLNAGIYLVRISSLQGNSSLKKLIIK